jgi:hypothetical protein
MFFQSGVVKGCILTLFLRKLLYIRGAAANVGQRFQPVQSHREFLPNQKIKRRAV